MHSYFTSPVLIKANCSCSSLCPFSTNPDSQGFNYSRKSSCLQQGFRRHPRALVTLPADLIQSSCFFVLFKDFFLYGPILKPLLNLLQDCFRLMFCFFGHKTRGILASWPEIEPTLPALEVKVGLLGKSLSSSFISTFR